jgi:hypothetical protein
MVVALLAGCGPASLTSSLPTTLGGQAIVYTEHSAADEGPDLVFYSPPIEAVGGSLADARVAVGMNMAGDILVAVRVPGADASRMVEPFIQASGLNPVARQTLTVDGKATTVLTLPPTTHDRAYIYTFGDILVLLETAQLVVAEDAWRSLP